MTNQFVPRTVCAVSLIVLVSSVPKAQVTITIDTADVQQTMQGFGSSVRVFNDPHIIGGAVSDPISDSLVITTAQEDVILDLLYSDLGLTRVRPATGEDGPIENPNDNSDPYVADTTAFDFTWKKMDAHIDHIARLVPRGVNTYFPATIKLEGWMTEAEPAEFAEWAFMIIKRWRDRGYELPYYSMINEPGYAFSGIWSGEFIRDAIKVLGPKLDSAAMDTRIVIPDDVNPIEALARAQVIMADSTARSYVGALAFHLYGGNDASKTALMLLGQQYDVPLWMTEHYRQDAFDWGDEIHDLIANYNVSAVDHMWGFFTGQFNNGATLIALDHTGTTYNGYVIQKQYYVTGQYSRFVRPGARRVGANSSNSDVRVAAFTDDGQSIIVVHNNHGVPQTVDLSTNGMDAGVLASVRTSAAEDWAVLPNTPVTNGAFSATLAPNSITTFYTDQLSTGVEQLSHSTTSMVVFPNPASNTLTVSLISERPGDARIAIRDQSGRLVLQEMVRTRAGLTHMALALPDMANGVYSISTEVHGKVLTNRLLVVQ